MRIFHLKFEAREALFRKSNINKEGITWIWRDVTNWLFKRLIEGQSGI